MFEEVVDLVLVITLSRTVNHNTIMYSICRTGLVFRKRKSHRQNQQTTDGNTRLPKLEGTNMY